MLNLCYRCASTSSINDLSFRDLIKNVVFIWKGVCKPSNEVNSIEFSAPKKLKTEYGFGCSFLGEAHFQLFKGR